MDAMITPDVSDIPPPWVLEELPAECYGEETPRADADAATVANTWPAPEPLSAKIEPLPYPIDALPGIIGDAVAEVESFVQAPVALVAASALSVASLAVQAHHDVERERGLRGPVSLFMLTIADSGERKSTCDRLFMQGIEAYEAAQREAAKPALKEYAADLDAWNAKLAGMKRRIEEAQKNGKPTRKDELLLRELRDDEPAAPRVPRLLWENTTPEELAYRLWKNWPSGGIMSDEGGQVLGSHGMNSKSIMGSLSQLNKLWDGGTVRIDRRTSESFTVTGARLTIGLMVQPETIRAFADGSNGLARGSGFFARFLIAWPESMRGFRQFRQQSVGDAITKFGHRVESLLRMEVEIGKDGGLNPAQLKLSPEARIAWRAFHDRIEGQLKPGGDLADVGDAAAKIADNAARLAAVMHVFNAGAGEVPRDTFERAARIAEWHVYEARRFFGELLFPPEMRHAIRLDEWLFAYCRAQGAEAISTRDAQRKGPVRQKVAFAGALESLVKLKRCAIKKEGKRRIVVVNPRLLQRATVTVATGATGHATAAAGVATVAAVNVATPADPEVWEEI